MTYKPVLKDRKPGRRKLALNRETLRELTHREMDQIVGGSGTDTALATLTRICGEDGPAFNVSPFKGPLRGP
ncbi:MAG TPA: class I lanthipeptide [Polyangia bacterium]|jgi:hypothetical protein|nr:class I lanthipeptide [Polyangia bacterium]